MNLGDLNEYEKMTWETSSYELENAVEDLLAEVKRLRKNESELLSAISQVRERVYKELIQKMKELIE